MNTALHFSPLSDRGLMVKRARAEDAIVGSMCSAAKAEPGRDRAMFAIEAERAAIEANEYDAALVQRIGWSPVGIGRGHGDAL